MSSRLRIESPPETTAGKAIDAVLPAITAIERYGEAARLLEEIRSELADAIEDVEDGCRLRDTVKSLLAKLEAHHVR